MTDKIFLLGAKKNITQEYRKASLFVMSSDYEGFPNALVEAMAMGVPVICTDFATGVARELIHEENGILVPIGDTKKMADAIKTLIKNEKKRDEMGKENFKIRETLDRKSKELMRNKEVLAVILKGVVSEYEGYTCRQIMDFIEGDSITSEEVTAGRASTRIIGEDKEFTVLGEKTSIFDTKFKALNPKLSTELINVNLHVDLEPQKTYRPGYPIEKRGLYYLARELSSQFSLVTDDTDYNSLEKCYSIWVCCDDIPKDERFSISFYEVTNTHNYGKCYPIKENYDLLSLVLIRLGNIEYNGNRTDEGYDVLHFLHTIMYPAREDFLNSIKQHIDFSHNAQLWQEVDRMSGLGMSVYMEGVEQGELRGAVKAYKKLKLPQAAVVEYIADEFDKTIAEAQEIVAQYWS